MNGRAVWKLRMTSLLLDIQKRTRMENLSVNQSKKSSICCSSFYYEENLILLCFVSITSFYYGVLYLFTFIYFALTYFKHWYVLMIVVSNMSKGLFCIYFQNKYLIITYFFTKQYWYFGIWKWLWSVYHEDRCSVCR